MRAALALLAVVLASACGAAGKSGGHDAASTPDPAPHRSPSAAATPAAGPSQAPRVTKVLTIVEENHGTAAVTRGMPYLISLAHRYGHTTGYRALTHPSLPNYLALAGGSTFGVHDDASSSAHPIPGPSVFDAALQHHHTAAVYAESMSQPCDQASYGRYAARHNPWTYFTSQRPACLTHDLPAGTVRSGTFHDAVTSGRLPDVAMLIPDLCDDAHDCSLATADRWLRSWMALVQQGPDWRSGHLAVVITFDEAEGSGDTSSSVPTDVATPALHGKMVTAPLSHLSWSRWMTDLVGAAPLRDARTAPSLGRAFGL